MQNKNTQNNTKLLVSIDFITYNHEAYIKDTLDGFLMQKTDFAYEVLIHDDASTDQTVKIIRKYEKKYPDIIKPIYQKENQYSKKIKISVQYQYPRALGKYIAICEGDDYWTDPYKLQKQVDFLEAHPDYGLVYTDADSLSDSTNIITKSVFKNILGIKDNTFENFLINTWWLAPCTWMIRFDVYKKFKCLQDNSYIAGDFPLLLIMSKNSKIYFLQESTAVYRVLTNSASHHTDIQAQYIFLQGILKMQMDFVLYYNVKPIIIEQIRCLYYTRIFDIVCIINNKKLKFEAFSNLKKHNKLILKKKMLYIITIFPFIRHILVKLYNKKLQTKRI